MGSRICDKCNERMQEGYVIDGGAKHYCQTCRPLVISNEEWEKLYTDEGDNYWTDWIDDDWDEECDDGCPFCREDIFRSERR